MNDHPFFVWLHDHNAFAWIGLILGIVGVLTSPLFGWPPAVLVGFLTVGGVAGSLLVAVFMWPPRYPFTCLECEKTLRLKGVRGTNAKSTERTLLRAKTRQDLFAYVSAGVIDGTTKNVVISYRVRGTSLRTQPKPYTILNAAQAKSTHSATGTGIDVDLHPPAPIQQGDIIEVLRDYEVDGGFANQREFFGKRMPWPTRKLTLEIIFDGVAAQNCQFVRYAPDGSPGSFSPLEMTTQGGTQTVNRQENYLRSGERCRILWDWV